MRRPARRSGLFILLALVLALWTTGCVTEPGTGRWQLGATFVGEAQANQMGLQAYQQILSEAKVSKNEAQQAMLRRVGRRVAAAVDERMAAGEEGAPTEPFQWEFTVIDEATVNAFCLPGGKVAFYSGILKVCEDEAGIAVVMGHEVAHAYLQHGRNRVGTQVVAQFGLAAVQAVLDGTSENETVNAATMGALAIGTQLSTLYWGREDESAADQIGLELMASAGYDPQEAVAFWGRMDALGGGAPPEFLSTHPHHDTRIENLQQHMPKALQIYERSGG